MSEEITAPVPGKIVRLDIEAGTTLEEGDEILVIETMKMETPVYAPCSGKVKALNAKAGDEVDEGDLIATVE
ncbi:acetyl-CoA carboxylase biotin carboxyl carrier protein subunit [Desulfospira joergensenii]|uniref:acetyl-CoA carboxylase biotin carboxyl carrier protein subunit n=1 Tax=Desulfospira joergensenii TaxID=53329 RepID=UPI0003B4D322|nr:acetyl-CoA carboxylase biotin carboxyl carrier protein subunit [Desulfospira joergensenii]